MAKVTLENISKTFGNTIAVNHVDFSIEEGNFFTFLGPSGCGKTTILRMIAGFIKPDKGRIFLGNKDITLIPSENREVGMVFQNYALFPHMNVYENIAYGLKIKKIPKKQILAKVEKYLHLVSLDGYEDRKISELSGGEQQRIALARSLIIEPKVLLLDEPLSNLDANLRDKMRIEIGQLQKSLGITTIFVTHDQSEALTMSDKLAVFNRGECVQIGTPKEIYQEPKNTFVATFIGDTNLLEAVIDDKLAKLSNGMILDLKETLKGKYISIRPQDIRISKDVKWLENVWKGKVDKIQFNGATIEYMVYVKGLRFKVSQLNHMDEDCKINVDDEVYIYMNKNAIRVLS
ncbi:ABC transporter ATP-binding protein [Crassaminicella profunda]|uniref:ABC transporter ATP-binding protein n=1 Tax=Crassaminicella profunda TaxID=1286698 RepID=UPI001CA6B3B2|nr:ABC transporter ATP-binding protein [Crassaminicella profunda]QZY57290.1 ABC transporter ATP-binding protein [Crassaminicella profunda]